jgi:hypothetical protein
MIRASRQPAGFSQLRAGPVIVKGVRYGTLKYDQSRGVWRFSVEDGGRPGPRSGESPGKALPARVQRDILDEDKERNPMPRGAVTRGDLEDLMFDRPTRDEPEA